VRWWRDFQAGRVGSSEENPGCAWQRTRNEQNESKQALKGTQRAVQALRKQGSWSSGGSSGCGRRGGFSLRAGVSPKTLYY
jgi:hypothetical protein